MSVTGPIDTPEQMDELRRSHIAEFPDFPEPGILFRDITPLLGDGDALRRVIRYWCSLLPDNIEYVVGTEARGFTLGAPLAYELGAGFVPARKAGKLPGSPRTVRYDLEYGSAAVEIPAKALPRGARTLVVDDLLATGGTAAATIELTREFEVELLGASFLIELQGLSGRDRLPGVDITTVWSIPN